jgi:hypothetical protein
MKHINRYNDSMRKSMMDKLFFIDKVDADIFVDFGCADGSMINLMNDIFPRKLYYGYDHNKKMIELSKKNNPEDNCRFFTDWTELLETIKVSRIINKNKVKVCLIFSSVLHEIENKTEFFHFINFKSFDYLVIRDMYLSDDKYLTVPQLMGVLDKIPHQLKAHYGSKLFETKNIIQAMFKSYYMHNLKHELKEDYFSFNKNHIRELEMKYHMKPLFKEFFLLTYWKDTLLKDFGFSFGKLTTHTKLIYKI